MKVTIIEGEVDEIKKVLPVIVTNEELLPYDVVRNEKESFSKIRKKMKKNSHNHNKVEINHSSSFWSDLVLTPSMFTTPISESISITT